MGGQSSPGSCRTQIGLLIDPYFYPTFTVLMPPKKCKLSGLSRFELRQAYNSLIKLKQTAVHETSDEEDPGEEGFEEQIDTMISLLESKLEGFKSFTFSGMNATDLTELKIMFIGHLRLKPNRHELVAATTSLGQNELWSSTNLYRQLLLLENLVPKSVCL